MVASNASSTDNRAFAAAHFALELNGQKNGIIKSIEGGGVKADVTTYQQGGNYDRWRQLGKPKFEDFKLQVGMSMSEPFYAWISQFFTGKQERHDGAIVAGDFYYAERARREFKFGLIREIAMPALSGDDKNPVYMSISVSVESMEFFPGKKGAKLDAGADTSKQKLWKACDFKFNLAGYKIKATKVDAFTIKQNIIEYHMGGSRAPTKTPSQIEFPQLSFYVAESEAGPLIERFMLRGGAIKPAPAAPIPDGSIEYRTSDGTTLATVNFHNSEIIAITPDKSDSGSEDIKKVKIDLSTESMDFVYK